MTNSITRKVYKHTVCSGKVRLYAETVLFRHISKLFFVLHPCEYEIRIFYSVFASQYFIEAGFPIRIIGLCQLSQFFVMDPCHMYFPPLQSNGSLSVVSGTFTGSVRQSSISSRASCSSPCFRRILSQASRRKCVSCRSSLRLPMVSSPRSLAR